MNINVVSPSKQIITINLTDPVDPLFLFSIDIGEQEFHYLKQEQSLLIEFQHFPQIFFEMLDMCSKSYSKQSGSYNYICILHHREQKDALLIIQERTQFKEVNHLILAVKQANDATLKRHLSNLAKYFKTKSEILVSENSKLCESIDSFVIEVKNLKEELQNLKYQQGSELEALRLTHQKEINEMKEKLYNENKTKMDTKEDEFNQHTHELESKITELSNKLDLLTKDKLTLEENNIKLFASERDLIGRNNILSSELAIYKEEVNVLRNDNSSLNQATFVKEKQITELTYKNENLFAQLQEKDINIQNLNALVENLSTQRTELEENLKGVRATNTKLEDKLQSSINEINKGNDIIQKLQAEIKTQKQKVKLKQQSITTQEQLINQKQIQIDDLIKANNELKREVDKKEEETKSNRMNESNLKANLEEAKKIIEENEKLIRFLNKNLNENQNPFRNFMNEKTGIDNLSTRQLETNTKNPDFVSGSSFGKQPYFNTDSFQPSETNQKMIMPETNFAGLKPGTKELKATGLSNTNYETGSNKQL